MNLISIFQVILSIALVALILLQRSDTGLGETFGGSGVEGGHFGRRGSEKMIFSTTIVVAILFVILSILALILS